MGIHGATNKKLKLLLKWLSFSKRVTLLNFRLEGLALLRHTKKQLAVLHTRLSSEFGAEAEAMELNTVDGFQGREVDILILTTVRATPVGTNQSQIGFFADGRRMNVALTRAKLSLWILGNTQTLKSDPNWGALVKDAADREVIIGVERPYNMMFEQKQRAKNPESKSSKRKTKEEASSERDQRASSA